MTKNKYTYKERHIEKIGNTIIFLSERVENLGITKLLKLLYILDEESVKETGNPFLGLDYEVWQRGPVDRILYIDLTSHISIFKNHVKKKNIEIDNENKTIYTKVNEFSNKKFCEYELKLMEQIIEKFGGLTSKQLVAYTHKLGSLWHQIAKENNVLEDLENEKISSTDLKINLSKLIEKDEFKKSIFEEYKLRN